MIRTSCLNAFTPAGSGGSSVAAMKPAQPRRPRVALVLSRVDFSRPDYLAAREALELHGNAITVVSSRIGPATSDAKYEANQVAQVVQAEVAFGEIQPSDFDAIVFVPSSNSEFLDDLPLNPLV